MSVIWGALQYTGYCLKRELNIRSISNKDFRASSLFVPLTERDDSRINDFFRINEIEGRRGKKDYDKMFIGDIGELVEPIRKIERFKFSEKKISKNLENKQPEKEMEAALNIASEALSNEIEQLKQQISQIQTKFQGKNFLIILTDFSGSGKTALREIKRLISYYKFEQIFFLSYIITQEAIDRLNALPKNKNENILNIIPGLIIPKKAKLLEEKCVLYNGECRSKIIDICNKYFKCLDHPDIENGGNIMYGFENCGITLVLYTNCPNNTLPIIWGGKNKWYPLFKRVSSYE